MKKKKTIIKKPKGFFKFEGIDKKNYRISLKEKKFCEAYLEFQGNGVDAIFEAGYKPKNRKIAAQMAYENLIKPDISQYINFLLEEYGFKDENVEKQHLFLLNQFGDLASKKAAIDMFYKLKGKYAAEKLEHSGKVELEQTTEISPALKKAAEVYEQEMKKGYGSRK